MKKLAYVLCLFMFVSCVQPQKEKSGNTYQQNFKSGIAVFIRERNGQPVKLASAFLIDKQRGVFASAKHFVGIESDGRAKIFFNGKVYNGFLLKLPAITDLVLIGIDGRFNPAEFPEQLKIAEKITKGEKVFVQGIHPHKLDKNSEQKTALIYTGLYRMTWQKEDCIFDSLEAEIIKTDGEIANKSINGESQEFPISNTFIELKTANDHKFSFAGLSGGPTVNAVGEVVGVNSNEKPAVQADVTEDEDNKQIKIKISVSWNTMNIVPATELVKLMQLAKIK